MTHKVKFRLSQEGQKAALLAGEPAQIAQSYELPVELLSRALALPEASVDGSGSVTIGPGRQPLDSRPADAEGALAALEAEQAKRAAEKAKKDAEARASWDTAVAELRELPVEPVVEYYRRKAAGSLFHASLSRADWPNVPVDSSPDGRTTAYDNGSLRIALEQADRLAQVQAEADRRNKADEAEAERRGAEEQAETARRTEEAIVQLCSEGLYDGWLDEDGDLRTVHERLSGGLPWRSFLQDERLEAHYAKLQSQHAEHAEQYRWALEEAVREWGSDNQRARLAEGVLPEDELRDVVRERLFAPLASCDRYDKITSSDLEAGADYPCEEPSASYRVDLCEKLSAAQYDRVVKIRSALAEAGVSSESTRVEVKRHVGQCEHCDALVTRDAVHVTILWHHRPFSRAYAVPDTPGE